MKGADLFDTGASQDEWRRRWKSDPPIGDIGNRVLFENEHVRVWHLEVAPGNSSPLHTHMRPYFSVIIESARLQTAFADGSTSVDEDGIGDVVWFGLDDRTRTHTLTNIGATRCVARVIELL
jgi:hypothetical protein